MTFTMRNDNINSLLQDSQCSEEANSSNVESTFKTELANYEETKNSDYNSITSSSFVSSSDSEDDRRKKKLKKQKKYKHREKQQKKKLDNELQNVPKAGENYQKRAKALLSIDERKRPYNCMYEMNKPPLEEIEDYYRKRKREEDPMNQFM